MSALGIAAEEIGCAPSVKSDVRDPEADIEYPFGRPCRNLVQRGEVTNEHCVLPHCHLHVCCSELDDLEDGASSGSSWKLLEGNVAVLLRSTRSSQTVCPCRHLPFH